jgi:hypothetical protein
MYLSLLTIAFKKTFLDYFKTKLLLNSYKIQRDIVFHFAYFQNEEARFYFIL